MFVGFFSYMHHNIIHLACSYYFIFRRGSMFVGPVHLLITFLKKQSEYTVVSVLETFLRKTYP